MLAAALQACAAWQADAEDVGVAINLSPRTLHERQIGDLLLELLPAQRLRPAMLTLEIGESGLVPYPQRAVETLQRLHQLGVRLAIDEFGTGYSSLAYLKRLPVDEIKVDPSFVLDLMSDPNDAAIVRATIDLAHNLGLQITADGVENGETLGALRAMGCDAVEGGFLGEPLAPGQLGRWFAGG